MALPNTNRIVERIAGFTKGSVTRNMVFNLGVSKIAAASSRLASILRKMLPINM